MKKVTMLFEDNFRLEEFGDVLQNCLEFHLEAIPDSVEASKKRRTIRKVSGTTTLATIAEHYTPDGMFTKEVAAKWLKDKGFSPHSAGPAISALKKNGYLKQISHQKYQWINIPV